MLFRDWTSTPYRDGMGDSDRHTTPRRPLSVGDELWDPLGVFVGDRNRSKTMRELLAYFLRVPGSRMPERPPPGWWEEWIRTRGKS